MEPTPLNTRRQLHWELADRLRDDIRAAKQPGDQLESVRDLSRTWGVSIAVVRAAQALLCQEGTIEVRHGSGARVADAAAQRRVGLYSELDLLHPRASSFHAVQVRYLRGWFEEHGIETEFYMGKTQPGETLRDPTCQRFLEDMENGRLKGVVLIDRPRTGPWDRLVHNATIPMVGAGTPYNADSDYQAFVLEGVRRLAAQGATRLATLSWAEGVAGANITTAATRYGMEIRPGWQQHDLHPQLVGAGWEEFREIWAAHPEKPDGLLVCDDLLLAEAAVAIAELGIRVPDDLHIVSHRNAGNQSRYSFPITWIEFNPTQAANALGKMLMQRMDGKPLPPQTVKLTFTVVPDQSESISVLRPREPSEACRSVHYATRR